MASETRSVRPFEVMNATQSEMRQLIQVTGHDFEKRSAVPGGRLTLSEEDFLNSQIVLWLGRTKEENLLLARTAVEEIKTLYPNDDGPVEFVVSMSNKRLKMTDVVLRRPVRDAKDLPMKIELDRLGVGGGRPRALQTPGDGCEILVEFLLGSELDRSTLLSDRAWRKGSWLARASIGVTADAELTGPQVLPLTEAVRSIHGVPTNTLHYCHVLGRGPHLLTAGRFDDLLEFYVDQAVYEAVLDDPSADWSERLQLGWILDLIKTYLLVAMQEESFREFDPFEDEWSGSVLRAILEKAADSTREDDVRDSLQMLRHEPWKFLATLENSASLAQLEQTLIVDVEGEAE